MAVPKTIDQANVITNQTITTTAETIIVTSPQVEIVKDNGFVWIWAAAALLPGTNSTAVALRIRKGTTLTGTIVGNPQAATVTAGNQFNTGYATVDTYALAGNVQYVLTMQLTAASANSTVQEAYILVMSF